MEGIHKPQKNHCLCTPVPLNKTEDTKDIIFPAYSLLFALKAGRQTGVVAKMRKYARYPSPFSPLSPLAPLLLKHVFGLSSSLSIEAKTRGVSPRLSKHTSGVYQRYESFVQSRTLVLSFP